MLKIKMSYLVINHTWSLRKLHAIGNDHTVLSFVAGHYSERAFVKLSSIIYCNGTRHIYNFMNDQIQASHGSFAYQYCVYRYANAVENLKTLWGGIGVSWKSGDRSTYNIFMPVDDFNQISSCWENKNSNCIVIWLLPSNFHQFAYHFGEFIPPRNF
jgi:hypothetical protein